jgi:tripeptidyl-peptidase I
MRIFFLSVLLGYCGVNSNDLAEQTSLTHAIEKDSLHIRHVFRESIPRLSTRQDLSRLDRLHHEYIHKVIFVIRQKNMDKLTDILHDISDPISANYGMHMTKEEISIMTSNPEGHNAIMTYLHAKGVTVFHEILDGEFITASAPISTWEQTFDTQFFSYHQKQRSGETEMFVRAEKYSVPIELDDHVATVFNTIQLPYQLSGDLKNKIIEMESETETEMGLGAGGGAESSHRMKAQNINPYPTFTTPQKLRAAYNMGDSMGSNRSTQAVYATIGQYFSPADLAAFQVIAAGLPNNTVASAPYGFSSDKVCLNDPSDCVEGNLDIQYIMTMSPVSPTTYWYSSQGFTSWLFSVALAKVPPLVISLSYGADEALMTDGEMENFNVYAIKLCTGGSTILVASGDDGAIVHESKAGGQAKCAYSPSFPSTCPYVTSVGATQVRGVVCTVRIVCMVLMVNREFSITNTVLYCIMLYYTVTCFTI